MCLSDGKKSVSQTSSYVGISSNFTLIFLSSAAQALFVLPCILTMHKDNIFKMPFVGMMTYFIKVLFQKIIN